MSKGDGRLFLIWSLDEGLDVHVVVGTLHLVLVERRVTWPVIARMVAFVPSELLSLPWSHGEVHSNKSLGLFVPRRIHTSFHGGSLILFSWPNRDGEGRDRLWPSWFGKFLPIQFLPIQFLPIQFWPIQFWPIHFGSGVCHGGPRRVGRPKISFFFPLRLPFSLCLSLFGVLSWNFGGV